MNLIRLRSAVSHRLTICLLCTPLSKVSILGVNYACDIHPPSSQLDLARPGSAGVGGNPMEGQSTNTIPPQLKTELLVLNLLITPSNTPASHFKSLRKLKTNQGVVPGFWFLLCVLVSMLVSPGLPPPTVSEVYTIIYI